MRSVEFRLKDKNQEEVASSLILSREAVYLIILNAVGYFGRSYLATSLDSEDTRPRELKEIRVGCDFFTLTATEEGGTTIATKAGHTYSLSQRERRRILRLLRDV